jgi:hypothetical protein
MISLGMPTFMEVDLVLESDMESDVVEEARELLGTGVRAKITLA